MEAFVKPFAFITYREVTKSTLYLRRAFSQAAATCLLVLMQDCAYSWQFMTHAKKERKREGGRKRKKGGACSERKTDGPISYVYCDPPASHSPMGMWHNKYWKMESRN